jgi:hypothetical protein
MRLFSTSATNAWLPTLVLAVMALSSHALAQPRGPALLPMAAQISDTGDEPPPAEGAADEPTDEAMEEPSLLAPPNEESPPAMPEPAEQGKAEEPAAETAPEEVQPPPGEGGSMHEPEPLWPDYYGPPYSAAYDPSFTLKGGCCACPTFVLPHSWGQFDYLLWWTKGDRLPPLVTTAPGTAPVSTAGALDQPGTQVLFGAETVANNVRSGGRMNLGIWLDADEHFGVGGSLLGLQRLTSHFFASSAGDVILARPFFDVRPLNDPNNPRQDAEIVAYPNIAAGQIKARTSNDFIAAEVYLREALARSCDARLDLIYGYRFANLDEVLTVEDQTVSINPNVISPPFGTTIVGHDSFLTRSSFHGGMFGLWYKSRGHCWTWDIVGKVALGNVHQIAYIQGSNKVTAPGFSPFTTSGSLLTQPTNIGTFRRDRFAAMPELQINLTRHLTENLRLRLGYTVMAFTNVLQVGRQIDQAVNPSQIGGGSLAGAARPQFDFHATRFWLQGINFGIEYSY